MLRGERLVKTVRGRGIYVTAPEERSERTSRVAVSKLTAWLNVTTMSARTGTSRRLLRVLALPLGALWLGQPGPSLARRSVRCWSRW